jgi:Co/Zn/Cd efflux system component
MGHNCNHGDDHQPKTKGYRTALWIAFALNATMCVVEILFGLVGNSTSLHADALDFFGDSTAYLITLFVLGRALSVRAKVGMAKGIAMLIFGLLVSAEVIRRLYVGDFTAVAFVMGWVGFAALVANIISAFVLLRFREGDSNVRSVWLCTRNDAVANVLIIIAGVAIYFTGLGWLDLVTASIIAYMALHSAVAVIKQARKELKG